MSDQIKQECLDTIVSSSGCFMPPGTDQDESDHKTARGAYQHVWEHTIGAALLNDPGFWGKPGYRQYYLKQAALIGAVAGAFATADGRSYLEAKDIGYAANEVIARARKLCHGPGPGCSSYVDYSY